MTDSACITGDRDKKRLKATKILSTQHNVPGEEEGGGRGEAGAARSPARSPQMEDMDQGKSETWQSVSHSYACPAALSAPPAMPV